MLQDELAKALNIGKSQLSKFKTRGCPVDDIGNAKNWITANIKPRFNRRKASPIPTGIDIPPQECPAPAGEYTLEARLERARKMELAIYNAAEKALGSPQAGQLQSLVVSHQKAQQAVAEAEADALRARKEAGELIHRDTVKAVMAEIMIPLRNSLDLLPVTERSRCNPASPEVAESALRSWKDTLLLRLSRIETKF